MGHDLADANWRAAGLQDEAIVLRPWEASDSVADFRTERIGRYFGRAAGGVPERDPSMPDYAILDRAIGEVVGRVWCRWHAWPPEVGYFLRAASSGNGFATRALRLVSTWLFDVGGAGEVVLFTHPDNEPSQAVALRAGFRRDGSEEDYALFKDGTRRALRFVLRRQPQ